MEANNNAVHFQDGEDMNLFKLPAINIEQAYSLKDFDYLRITKEKDIPNPDPTIKIGGGAFASPGNISAISAAAKAGKTAFTGALIAGAISMDGNIDGFNDVEVMTNISGKAVIHFDTEQSEADQQYFVRTVMRRAQVESTPDYYRSYNIRKLELSEYKEKTSTICQLCSDEFNGVHLIIIDGGADYVLSVNDEEQTTIILDYFKHLSIHFNCPVILVVHLNPGSEKERGHLGSSLQRKCYALYTIKKEGEVSTAEPKFMRKAGNDIPLIHFAFDKEKGYHIQIDAPNKADAKAKKESARFKELAANVFTIPNAFGHDEAVEKIMKDTQKQWSTAKTYLKNMTAWELVIKGDDGRYRLNQSINGSGSKRVNSGQS